MPGVTIQYRTDILTMTPDLAGTIRETVRHFGVVNFSTQEVQLSKGDFTIHFYGTGPFDEMSNHVIVRVPLHHFAERTQDSDELATRLAKTVSDAISAFPRAKGITVGASIQLCEIGWGTATVD